MHWLSLYFGIGDVNLGGLTGIGTEWMYRNVSVSLGLSMGIKVYCSDVSFKNRIFAGVNHIAYYPDPYYYYYPVPFNNMAVTCDYRRTVDCGVYISPYAGIRVLKSVPPYFHADSNPYPFCGLNIGYQFDPVKKYREN